MKELGITKGEWYVKFMHPDEEDSDFWVKSDVNSKVHYGTDIMAEDYGEHDGYPREQRLADAALIADAGNVAQSCGLLPSELLRQRDELKEALHEIYMANLISSLPTELSARMAAIAESAIKSTER